MNASKYFFPGTIISTKILLNDDDITTIDQIYSEIAREIKDEIKELNEKLRTQADKQDMTMNALIRIALEKYLKEISE